MNPEISFITQKQHEAHERSEAPLIPWSPEMAWSPQNPLKPLDALKPLKPLNPPWILCNV